MRRNANGRQGPLLIVFGGLPGTGKTSIARELARELGTVFLRIDSIEQAILDSRAAATPGSVGYEVGYAVAEDNLRLGQIVVADSVNPLGITRDAWTGAARRAGATAIEIEITCSDREEHRRRVEARKADIPGLRLPTWNEVVSREYDPWDRKHIVIDTAGRGVSEIVSELREALRQS